MIKHIGIYHKIIGRIPHIDHHGVTILDRPPHWKYQKSRNNKNFQKYHYSRERNPREPHRDPRGNTTQQENKNKTKNQNTNRDQKDTQIPLQNRYEVLNTRPETQNEDFLNRLSQVRQSIPTWDPNHPPETKKKVSRKRESSEEEQGGEEESPHPSKKPTQIIIH
ncbi:hypothetical protein FKM82_022704 [Ascaphus truei]